jgi:hypothetical protein
VNQRSGTTPPCRPAPPRRGALAALALVAAGALLLAGAAPAHAAHYAQGEKIQFIGVVADRQGRPLQGVRVVLEASRSYFNLREFRRSEKDTRRVSGESDAKGEYSIEWPWDGYYNHFKLVAGVPVRKGKEETFHVLDEVEVTDRVGSGAPVVSTLEVRDRAFLDHLRDFLSSLRSEDERRVYDDMGTPDDVKRIHYSGSSDSTEVTWWYFEAGKVYRFRDGRLEQVADFSPVRAFSTSSPQER